MSEKLPKNSYLYQDKREQRIAFHEGQQSLIDADYKSPEEVKEAVKQERERIINWMLEETLYKESHQETKIPRFMALTSESLEYIKKTGEFSLFKALKGKE